MWCIIKRGFSRAEGSAAELCVCVCVCWGRGGEGVWGLDENSPKKIPCGSGFKQLQGGFKILFFHA